MQIAGVLLKLPDGRWTLHRRDKNAPASPNLLGFFGGKIEENESAQEAARRELSEETSLDTGPLKLHFVAKYEIPEPEPAFAEPKVFHLFAADISQADFKVHEGLGLEIYSARELLKRTDLTPSVQYALNNLIKSI